MPIYKGQTRVRAALRSASVLGGSCRLANGAISAGGELQAVLHLKV